MLSFYILFPLLPLLRPALAVPSLASSTESIIKRDDCHGSVLCSFGGDSRFALDMYNATANANTYYNGYTSYAANDYTAIYECPKGKYPSNVTGAQIHEAGLVLKTDPDRCKRCGTHWMYDSDNQLKCRITLNYCHNCKNVVNGRNGDNSGFPSSATSPPVATGAAMNSQNIHGLNANPLVHGFVGGAGAQSTLKGNEEAAVEAPHGGNVKISTHTPAAGAGAPSTLEPHEDS